MGILCIYSTGHGLDNNNNKRGAHLQVQLQPPAKHGGSVAEKGRAESRRSRWRAGESNAICRTHRVILDVQSMYPGPGTREIVLRPRLASASECSKSSSQSVSQLDPPGI